MNIIKQETEQVLLEDLKSLWENAPAFRCITLRFSNLETPKETWFPYLVKTLETYFADDIQTIYVCHDNDIFLTTGTLTQKNLDILLTHLKPKLSPASLQGLAAIFEMKVDWPKLRTMCERKIEMLEILEAKRNQKKREELTNVNREQTLSGLDVDLISSLSMRREMREASVVMVVEDDPFTQKLIQNTIKGNHELYMSADGQGAIMTYVNKAPDILFLDIGLPDIDGHEVLKKLFKIDPDAYVVMFSGNGDKENVMKAIELGAKGFVGKPFTKDKIFQYVQKSPFIQSKQI